MYVMIGLTTTVKFKLYTRKFIIFRSKSIRTMVLFSLIDTPPTITVKI